MVCPSMPPCSASPFSICAQVASWPWITTLLTECETLLLWALPLALSLGQLLTLVATLTSVRGIAKSFAIGCVFSSRSLWRRLRVGQLSAADMFGKLPTCAHSNRDCFYLSLSLCLTVCLSLFLCGTTCCALSRVKSNCAALVCC